MTKLETKTSKILDCTIRDGGYINNWKFSDEFIDEYIDIMDKLNMDYVEVGYINDIKKSKNNIANKVGKYKYLTKECIQKFTNKNFKVAVMADYRNINMDILNQNLKIDLVRICFWKKDMREALLLCKKIQDMGYNVAINAAAVTTYNDSELKELFDLVNKYNLDFLYIVDSYGSLTQNGLFNLLNKFSNDEQIFNIGIHLHNNQQNAYSNFEYVNNKNNKKNSDKINLIVDTTLFGMGRGAGNLPTELVVKSLNPQININLFIALCIFIQNYIKPIYKINENYWGYDLDYLMSGFLQMHPGYVVHMRELNIDMGKRILLLKEIKNNYNYEACDKKIFNNLKY